MYRSSRCSQRFSKCILSKIGNLFSRRRPDQVYSFSRISAYIQIQFRNTEDKTLHSKLQKGELKRIYCAINVHGDEEACASLHQIVIRYNFPFF